MKKFLFPAVALLVLAGLLAGCDDDPAPKSNNAYLSTFVYSNPDAVTQPGLDTSIFTYSSVTVTPTGSITVTPTAADANATLRIRTVNSGTPTNNIFSPITSGASRTYDMSNDGYNRVAARGQIIEVEVVSQDLSTTNLYEFIIRE